VLPAATFVFLVNCMNAGYLRINTLEFRKIVPLTERQQGKGLQRLNRQVFKKKKRIIENG